MVNKTTIETVLAFAFITMLCFASFTVGWFQATETVNDFYLNESDWQCEKI